MIFAFLIVVALAILNLKQHSKIFSYLILGVLLWLMVLKSGIHATIAGVVLAMFIPRQKNILHGLIKKIAPTVNFLILPIFAFANSGIDMSAFSFEQLGQMVTLGIILGLFLGKQLGIILVAWMMIKFKYAKLPLGTNWLEFYGVSLFAGIGFTMSLFISSLAFIDNNLILNQAKIGILCGSLLSLIGGAAVAFILKLR